MFGPFYRKAEDNVWHWIKNCPDFPDGESVQAMVGDQKPDPHFLCKKCSEIEINEFQKVMDPGLNN